MLTFQQIFQNGNTAPQVSDNNLKEFLLKVNLNKGGKAILITYAEEMYKIYTQFKDIFERYKTALSPDLLAKVNPAIDTSQLKGTIEDLTKLHDWVKNILAQQRGGLQGNLAQEGDKSIQEFNTLKTFLPKIVPEVLSPFIQKAMGLLPSYVTPLFNDPNRTKEAGVRISVDIATMEAEAKLELSKQKLEYLKTTHARINQSLEVSRKLFEYKFNDFMEKSTSTQRGKFLFDMLQKDLTEDLQKKVEKIIDSDFDPNISVEEKSLLDLAYGKKQEGVVKYIVNHKGFNGRLENHTTVFQEAYDKKEFEKIISLLKAGAKANLVNDKAENLVMHMCKSDQPFNKEVFNTLLEKGININAVDKEGNSAIHLAIMHKKNVVEIKDILQSFTESQKLKIGKLTGDAHKVNALWIAVQKGYQEIVQLLLDKNIEYKVKSQEDGTTALHLAVKSGNLNMVKMLAAKQDLLTIADKAGKLPLHYAVEGNNQNLIKAVLNDTVINIQVQNAEGSNALIIAVENNRVAVVKDLITDKNIDYKASKSDGTTALHVAIMQGNAELVKLLASKKELLSAKDGKGYTPLHCAVNASKLDMAILLVEEAKRAGVNVKDFIDVFDNAGKTPLHYAVKEGNLDMIKKLVELGADSSTPSMKGHNTPLHYAMNGTKADPEKFFEIVKFLRSKVTIDVPKNKADQLWSAVAATDLLSDDENEYNNNNNDGSHHEGSGSELLGDTPQA